MVSYSIVREFRDGRQQERETVHCIKKGSESTVCGSLDAEELRSVRNIGAFIESGIMCPECSEKIDEVI